MTSWPILNFHANIEQIIWLAMQLIVLTDQPRSPCSTSLPTLDQPGVRWSLVALQKLNPNPNLRVTLQRVRPCFLESIRCKHGCRLSLVNKTCLYCNKHINVCMAQGLMHPPSNIAILWRHFQLEL